VCNRLMDQSWLSGDRHTALEEVGVTVNNRMNGVVVASTNEWRVHSSLSCSHQFLSPAPRYQPLARSEAPQQKEIKRQPKDKKHTTGGIPRWSPTLVLVARFSAYVWQSGRDAQFSLTYGRMYQLVQISHTQNNV
jgi:hypothetical protein